MANFAGPLLTDGYADVLQRFKDRDESIAKMFHGTTDTNIVTGSVKYNQTAKRLEVYDGTAWQPDVIGNLATSSVATASIADDAITAPKIRLANSTYLRVNKADATAFDFIGIDGSDRGILNIPASKQLLVNFGGTPAWYFDAASFVPQGTTDTLDIGYSAGRIRNAYIKNLAACQSIDVSGVAMLVGPLTAHDLVLRSSNSSRWTISGTNGDLLPNATLTNIGSSGAPVKKVFADEHTGPASIDMSVYSGSGGNLYLGTNGVFNYWALRSASSGTLEPTGDNTTDLGASGAVIKNVFANTIKNSSGTLSVLAAGEATFGNISSNKINFQTNSVTRLSITAAGNLDIYPGTAVALTAGAILGYLVVNISGALTRKIPLYAV